MRVPSCGVNGVGVVSREKEKVDKDHRNCHGIGGIEALLKGLGFRVPNPRAPKAAERYCFWTYYLRVPTCSLGS